MRFFFVSFGSFFLCFLFFFGHTAPCFLSDLPAILLFTVLLSFGHILHYVYTLFPPSLIITIGSFQFYIIVLRYICYAHLSSLLWIRFFRPRALFPTINVIYQYYLYSELWIRSFLTHKTVFSPIRPFFPPIFYCRFELGVVFL